jgi:hypothetical protein
MSGVSDNRNFASNIGVRKFILIIFSYIYFYKGIITDCEVLQGKCRDREKSREIRSVDMNVGIPLPLLLVYEKLHNLCMDEDKGEGSQLPVIAITATWS